MGFQVLQQDSSCSVTMKCWGIDSEHFFKGYMGGRVKKRLFDIQGQAEQSAYLDSIGSTGFSKDRISDIFLQTFVPEPWRVGEALAQCFLEDQEGSRFPWNGLRDQKIDNASLPGADLIGFKGQRGDVRFLFGEVKTSSDSNHPPQVMNGRTGMIAQLEGLRDENSRRGKLVRWFYWRAKNSSWESDYNEALFAYYSSSECVYLQGALVRDTKATIDDLKSRGIRLSNGKPSEMEIFLYAVYCPCNISDFPELVGGESLS